MEHSGFIHTPLDDIEQIRRNLRDRYDNGFPIIKELLQNADDAHASRMDFGVTAGFGTAHHPLLRSPALFVINDGRFTDKDNIAIRKIGRSSKETGETTIGRFGLGLKSIFHLCEAFFYASSRTDLPFRILNPWHSQDIGDVAAHPEWDRWDQPAREADLLALRGRLSHITSGASDWFCLWVPLRQEAQLNSRSPIVHQMIGDRKDPALEIFVPDMGRQIANILPMLNSLNEVSWWDGIHQPDIVPVGNVSHRPGDHTRKYRGDFSTAKPGSANFVGQLAVNGVGASNTMHYAGEESLLSYSHLTALKTSPAWPKTLTDDGMDVPEKAVQHCAVYFTRTPAIDRGKFTSNWSVFLPVEAACEPLQCPGSWDYVLNLHGYFFVDAGRGAIQFDPESVNSAERKVQTRWNQVLRDRGTLSLVIPAIQEFVTNCDPAGDEVINLVRALSNSELFLQNRMMVCQDRQWVYRLSNGVGQWETVDALRSPLRIPAVPDSDPSRPWKVFPRLNQISIREVVTFDQWPALRRQDDYKIWEHNLLLDMFVIDSATVFRSRGLAEYFRDFVATCAESRELENVRVGSALLRTVRDALRSMGVLELRQVGYVIKELMKFVPSDRVFFVNVDQASAASDRVIDALAALETDVLVLPSYLDSGLSPAGRHANLPIADATKILQTLSHIRSSDESEATLNVVSNVATQIVRGVPSQSLEQLWLSCSGLRLFIGYDAAAHQNVALTWSELRYTAGKQLLFNSSWSPQRWELAIDLQTALRGERVLLLQAGDLAPVLLPDHDISPCNIDACVQALEQRPTLSVAASRTGLFGGMAASLTGSLQSPPSSRLVAALRYLIHGNSDAYSNMDELLIEPLSKGDSVWMKLVREAFQLGRQSWRLVPADLGHMISGNQHQLLKLQPLNAQTALKAVEAVGAEKIDCSDLTDTDYDDIILGYGSYLEVVRNLRMHPTREGSHVAIGPDTYLDSPETDLDFAPFRGIVQIVRRSQNPSAAEKQYRSVFNRRRWGPNAVIEVATRQEKPERFWKPIMDALVEANSQSSRVNLDQPLIERLKSTPFLLTRDAGVGAVAPDDILHIDGMEDVIDQQLKDADHAFCSIHALIPEIPQHAAFRLLRSWQIIPSPDDALAMLSEYAASDPRNLVGSIDVGKINLEVFNEAFQDAPMDVMRSARLIHEVCLRLSPARCREHLLPNLSRPISAERLASILEFIADRHIQAPLEQRDGLLALHRLYLDSAWADGSMRETLSRIRLLSKSGEWRRATQLTPYSPEAADGFQVSGDHTVIILRSDPEETDASIIPQQTRDAALFRKYDSYTDEKIRQEVCSSSESLIRWLRTFESSECPPEVLGGFLGVLGGKPSIEAEAQRFLGRRHLKETRDSLDWRPVEGSTASGHDEDAHTMIHSVRFIFDLVQGDQFETLNTVGDSIIVPGRLVHENLIPHDRLFFSNVRGRTYVLPLLAVEPTSVSRPGKLSDMLKRAVRQVAEQVYMRPVNNLDDVWDDLAQTEQLEIEITQDKLLKKAFLSLQQLGSETDPKIRAVLQTWEDAEDRITESKHSKLQLVTTGATTEAENVLTSATEELRRLLEDDIDVQRSLLEAVQRKVDDYYQYDSRSMPFELFQNADDASVELFDALAKSGPGLDSLNSQPRFIAAWSGDYLAFAHWGREINRWQFGSQNERSKGFHRDLEKMLLMNVSDKPEHGNVTGKFGLGFKSVFLVSDRPQAISGRLAFEIVAGMYPRKLLPAQIATLKERFTSLGHDTNNGTMFLLPVDDDARSTPDEIMSRFANLAGVLTAFASKIRHCELRYPNGTIKERYFAGEPVMNLPDVVRGSVDLPSGNLMERRDVLVIRADDGSLMLPIGPRGFARLPKDVPTIWVTAPTSHYLDLGFALNGKFALDIGRSQLATDASKNATIALRIGEQIGSSLKQVYDESRRDWGSFADQVLGTTKIEPYEFWNSLWKLVSASTQSGGGPATHLIYSVLWTDESVGIRTLLTDKAALPSGLSGEYQTLTRIPDVSFRVSGSLDTNTQLFLKVAQWDQFKCSYPVGTIVSGERVAVKLENVVGMTRMARVNLHRVISEHIGEGNKVTPELASQFGIVITETLMESLRDGNAIAKDEHRDLVNYLNGLRFKSKSGDYTDSRGLLSGESTKGQHRDEAMRAEFAPDAWVVSDEYTGPGLQFFRLVRPPHAANVKQMATWARSLTQISEQQALLNYLSRGEVGGALAETLREGDLSGTWLRDVESSEAFARFNSHEQNEILSKLHLDDYKGPAKINDPTLDPGTALERIYAWWQREGGQRLAEYERRLFPDELPFALNDNVDAVRCDPKVRKPWLELFFLGISLRMGRQTYEQHRTFLKQCRDRGWIEILSQPEPDLAEWLDEVIEHIDRQIGDEPYNEWLRNFIPMAQVSRWLSEYVELFLDLGKRSAGFDFNLMLQSRKVQDSPVSVAPLTKTLGIGANLVLRELVRGRVITGTHLESFSFVPSGSVRKLVGRLGCAMDESDTHATNSKVIHDFLIQYLGNDKVTFGGAFDIPLYIVGTENLDIVDL